VQQVIDRLRDLSAASFVESAALSTPVLEITVTSTDGKRVEKVQVFKTGNDSFARRENEPSIYKLEANAATEIEKAAADVKAPPPPAKPAGAAK
jgi:hypothetical protein